jgi:hypothetical protein
MTKAGVPLPILACATLLGSSCIAAQPSTKVHVGAVGPLLNATQLRTAVGSTSRAGSDARRPSAVASGRPTGLLRVNGSTLVVLGGPADQSKNIMINGRSNNATRNAAAINGTLKSRGH